MSKQQLQLLTDDVKQMKGRKNNRTQKAAHFCIPAQFCHVADKINFTKKSLLCENSLGAPSI